MFELFKSLRSLIVRQFLEPLSNFHCAILTLYNLNFMNPKLYTVLIYPVPDTEENALL